MDSGGTRIKYVNASNHEEQKPAAKLHGKSTKPAPEPRAKPEPDHALQTYEECRRAFNELAAMHAEAQTEASAAMRRLERTELELAREREQGAKYAAKIAGQETELRRVKEAKKAVEDLNSRLNVKLSSKAPDEKLAAAHRETAAERDRLKSAHRDAADERDRLRSAHRDAAEERDKLKQSVKAYADIVEHADQALGICARACAAHAPETANDMRETQETLRAFQRSARV